MKYKTENKKKARFDDVYTMPTPHAYMEKMAKNGYEIGEQARPYCFAAAEMLNQHTRDAPPVQMLDIGCSYGMGSAFVKYGYSFNEMATFFATQAPKEPRAASEAMRKWLKAAPKPYDVHCVGLDSSKPAIRFAMWAGLLVGGIARDFENPEISPNAEELCLLRRCNLLISTGAIGYVTARTIIQVVKHAGKDHPGAFGPIAVFTILRMFDAAPIRVAFENHGFCFDKVPGIMLRQRNFSNEKEKKEVLKVLHDKHLDTGIWENRGKLFAELFIAAKTEYFPEVLEKMIETHSQGGCPIIASQAGEGSK